MFPSVLNIIFMSNNLNLDMHQFFKKEIQSIHFCNLKFIYYDSGVEWSFLLQTICGFNLNL